MVGPKAIVRNLIAVVNDTALAVPRATRMPGTDQSCQRRHDNGSVLVALKPGSASVHRRAYGPGIVALANQHVEPAGWDVGLMCERRGKPCHPVPCRPPQWQNRRLT